MNLIDFEYYRQTRKIIPYEHKYDNDNVLNWEINTQYLFSATGEPLASGQSGQLFVVDSYCSRFCGEN